MTLLVSKVRTGALLITFLIKMIPGDFF